MSIEKPNTHTDDLSVTNVPFISQQSGEHFAEFLNSLPAYLWVEDFSALISFLRKDLDELNAGTLSAESELGHRISAAMQNESSKPVVKEWNQRGKKLSRASVKGSFESSSLIARAYEGLLREILFEIVQGNLEFYKKAYWKVFDETIILRLFVHVVLDIEAERCFVYLAGLEVEEDTSSPTDRLIRQNALLFDVSQAILTETNLDRFLSQTSQLVLDHFKAYMVYIVLVNVEKRKITNVAMNGRVLLSEEEIAAELPNEIFWQGLSGWAIRTGETVYSPKGIPDYRETPKAQKRREILEIGSVAVVPIVSHPKMLGTLMIIHSKNQENIGRHDIQIAGTIANQIAIGLRHFELQERAARMMHTDLITDLHNRQYFMQLLEKEFNIAREGGFPLGIVMIDIDNYSSIREKYGPQFARSVLSLMGERLRDCLMTRQVEIGRLDTDVFCVLFKIFDRDALWDVAENIRIAIEEKPFVSDPIVMKVTASLGVCHVQDLSDSFSVRECLATANQRMLMAKNKGRNQVFPIKGYAKGS
ncbi:MAG: sensor domain-containing diguanylate cyclase [Anaerolineae bacterium]|jgi:diguanylate cyclase (GGDEF)-like protein|nr:sensor domain-containing diguanylate cyclase [Anaerolineae bacterium]